jgi:ribosomal protein S12 methylthiotransferase
LYAHPATIDRALVRTMARVPNVAPYLDMPVQHGDDAVLRAMRRGTTAARLREVVGWVREAIPDVTLRTTILVGFPGETEEAFARLLALLEELAFDRVGCFVFSPESTTEAGTMEPRVPRELAEERRAQVMALQRRLLEAANRRRVGSTDQVLLDAVEAARTGGGRLAVGRTARDAPEVDGRVLVELPARGRAPRAGDWLAVRVTGTRGYDLVAEPA